LRELLKTVISLARTVPGFFEVPMSETLLESITLTSLSNPPEVTHS